VLAKIASTDARGGQGWWCCGGNLRRGRGTQYAKYACSSWGQHVVCSIYLQQLGPSTWRNTGGGGRFGSNLTRPGAGLLGMLTAAGATPTPVQCFPSSPLLLFTSPASPPSSAADRSEPFETHRGPARHCGAVQMHLRGIGMVKRPKHRRYFAVSPQKQQHLPLPCPP
jgi:hypothetical protein